MSSMAERLRDRSGKRPAYTIDDSDDDGDFVPRNPTSAQDKMEKIVRHDAVSFLKFSWFFCCYFMYHLHSFFFNTGECTSISGCS